jgi:hypothetical protein
MGRLGVRVPYEYVPVSPFDIAWSGVGRSGVHRDCDTLEAGAMMRLGWGGKDDWLPKK